MSGFTERDAWEAYRALERKYSGHRVSRVPWSCERRKFFPVDEPKFHRVFLALAEQMKEETIKINLEGKTNPFGLGNQFTPKDLCERIMVLEKPDFKNLKDFLIKRFFRFLLASRLLDWGCIQIVTKPEEAHISVTDHEDTIEVIFNWGPWTMMESGMPSGPYLLNVDMYRKYMQRIRPEKPNFCEGDLYMEEKIFWNITFGIYGSL